MSRIRVYGVLAVLLLSFAGAVAQNATTSLRGVVRDPSGAVVPGATITLTSKASGQVLTTQSKGSGEYQLLQLAPAKYVITATAPGFGTVNKTAELLVNQPATIDFSLGVTADNTVVDVNLDAQTLNFSDASMGDAKSNEMIQAIPSETRNVADLLSLQPGVLYLPPPNGGVQTDSRSGAVNGVRSDQGNVTLDGIDDNDQVNGYAFFGVLRETQDSTEEFRVTTGNANADSGRSSGAQVSLVTKSGTNKFHGAAYEYYRPTNTVANDFFNKNSEIASGTGNRPAKLLRNIFGGDVGGPILKDKLFFFGNYEGSRLAESKIVQRYVPCDISGGACVGTQSASDGYANGYLTYQGMNNPIDVLTPTQFAAVDANNGCNVCNSAAYPYGPGVNPKAQAYLKQLPGANGTELGDNYNTGSYTFASPAPISQNTTIVRLDYLPSAKHRVFVRGNLQKDISAGVEQFPAFTSYGVSFPASPPSSKTVDNSKGITAGDTWTITPNIVNDIRYGYIRQGYSNSGVGSGDYVDFRGLDSPTAETRTSIFSVPVNNIVDNLNITAGKHNVEVGVNWRLVHQNRTSGNNSFSSANTNYEWFNAYPGDPSGVGLDGTSDLGDYANDYTNLAGIVPLVSDQYNYKLTSATSGTLLADGTPLSRAFSANEYEGYIQDSWRIKPNLTIIAGVRYTVLQTPYETKGQEVTPTIDTDAFYKKREASALQSQIYEPDLTFATAGKFYGKPGFYAKQKDNFAPRFAVNYAPNPKTSIRAGAGLYYSHFGEALINDFDQVGEFGLSSTVVNQSGVLTTATSPRFTARNVLPFNNGTPTQTVTYPYTYPLNSFQIANGIVNKQKTPYIEAFDLSVQHELGGGFTLETNYVGRLGRHLVQSIDITQPVDYVDPQGGGDYYAAGTKLSKIVDANGGSPNVTVSPIQYFEDVFPYMANTDYPGESATQAIYQDEWAPQRQDFGATEVLQDIDFGPSCQYYGCPGGVNHQSRFWQDQFSSLYALSTSGMSYYNALQVTLHHPSRHGFQMDANYTFSKSLDYGSDAERKGAGNNSASHIIDTWHPNLNKAPSDFNTKHIFTMNAVDKLPFGRGAKFLAKDSGFLDQFIGGWQLSGVFRLTSGLPTSLYEAVYDTDYQYGSYAVITNPKGFIKQKYLDASGNPQYFSNPQVVNNGAAIGTPVRQSYPGEAGERNNLIGDGYLDLDTGLSKSWKVANYGALKFTWEVYNVTNTVRFDPESINTLIYFGGGSFGRASAELSSVRRMQFSLRYDF
jgi:hypothetical protein